MKVTATAKFVRLSPRKARLVIDSIRGLSVIDAERVLTVMNKKGAEPVLKLLRSAIANAENNFQLQKEQLQVSAITANEGMTIKRYTPRAFGRASMIRKRTSHLSIVIDDTVQAKKKVEKKKTVKKQDSSVKKSAKDKS